MRCAEIRDVPERWETIDSTERFSGYVINVRTDRVRMPAGPGEHAGSETVTREVVGHPGSVGVLALDDADRVLLIRQYRHPVDYLLWEVPAGLRDVPGEPAWQTAERELAEETGYRATEWHTLADVFSSPGMTDERIRIFLARGLTPIPAAELDFARVHEEADMPVVWVPLAEAVSKILRGDIHNQLAVTAVLAGYVASATDYRDLRPADAAEP